MRHEDDLRAAMQVLAADPPSAQDVLGVVRPPAAKRRRSGWILPVAAAAVTLAVVLTVTALVAHSRPEQGPPLGGTPPRVSTALVGVHWTLLTYQAPGAAPAQAKAALFVRAGGRATLRFDCGVLSGAVKLGNGHAAFGTLRSHLKGTCGIAGTSESKVVAVVRSVLTGSVRWSIRATRLTIFRPGVGSLTFLPAATAATISGRLLAVGGPAGVPARPLDGTVTITSGGKALTTSVGSDGRYSVTVAAGTYHLQGRSPQYQSGTLLCRALQPVVARPGGASTANVYCQEK